MTILQTTNHTKRVEFNNCSENIINSLKNNKMSCFQVLLQLRSFFKNEPRIKSDLNLMYKRRFEETIFYETCVSTLRYITRERQAQDVVKEQEQEQQQPFGRKSTRKSVQSVSHYQNATIDFGHFSQHTSKTSIPNTLSYMSINQKQQLLKELIQKSYVFIDLSDLFSGEDLETYENLVRKEIFEGEESIVESILETTGRRGGVKDRLKYFDSEALNLLNIYVTFCQKIKLKLQPQHQQSQTTSLTSRDQFLSRLILQLKARLQLQYPSQKFTTKYGELNKIVSQFKVMNQIIVATIQKTEGIHVIPQSSHQYAENFFTYPNISTLVSVILFMDQNFLKAIFERFLEGLKLCIGRMAEKLVAMEKLFVNRLKNDYFGLMEQPTNKVSSTHDLFTYNSNLNKILQGGHEIKFQYFRKSLRTLETLTTQREPIKCLKIIYELNKTIEKEHTEFINSLISQESQREAGMELGMNRRSMSLEMRKSQKSKKYSFSRETQRTIIEFLLARKKDKLRFIVTNIMITHFFVHPSQLKDKKGSCLAPFVQIIKSIGFGVQLE